jgi:hypothetical protein
MWGGTLLLGWDERYRDGSAYLDGAADDADDADADDADADADDDDDDDEDDGDSSTAAERRTVRALGAAAAFRRCVALHARQAGAVTASVNRAAEVEIFMGGDFFF